MFFPKGSFVLVRTVYAGIHTGLLEGQEGDEVLLKDARRIWRWSGAHTLSEVSQKGVNMDYTRISESVPLISLQGVSEIIPCSPLARENLTQSRWGG